MKKINLLIGIGLGIIIVVTVLATVSEKISLSFLKKEPQGYREGLGQGVVLIIDEGEGLAKEFKAEFKEGMTAFDLLKTQAEKFNIILKTKTYDIGILIEAIGDKENGRDGKYWLYYVNGELPMISADKKELKVGDKVEFKFEKSPF